MRTFLLVVACLASSGDAQPVNCTDIKSRYKTGECCGAMGQKKVNPGTASETTCTELRVQYQGGNCCAAKAPRLTTTGKCTVKGNCVSSPNFGNGFYALGDECIIEGVPQSPMQVKWFDVEPGYDKLIVNGVEYSANYDADSDPINNEYGTGWPEGVVPLDGQMIFRSDDAVTRSGFEICFDDPSFQGRTHPQPYTPQGAQGYPSWFTPQSECKGDPDETTCSNNGKVWRATTGPQNWVGGTFVKSIVSINNEIVTSQDAVFGQRLNETVEAIAVLADPPHCSPDMKDGKGNESGKGYIKNAADLAGKIVICWRGSKSDGSWSPGSYWANMANIISYNVPTAKAILMGPSWGSTDGNSVCLGGAINGRAFHPDVGNAGCNVPAIAIPENVFERLTSGDLQGATVKIQPASEQFGTIKSAVYVTLDNPNPNPNLTCTDDTSFKDSVANADCASWAPDCPLSEAITSCNGEVGPDGIPCEIGGWGPDNDGYYYASSLMQTVREQCPASCTEECLAAAPYEELSSFVGKYVPLPKNCPKAQLGSDAGEKTWWQMSGNAGCNPGEAEFSAYSAKYVMESDLEADSLHILSYSIRFENPAMPRWELTYANSEWVPFSARAPGLTFPAAYTSVTMDMPLSNPETLTWTHRESGRNMAITISDTPTAPRRILPAAPSPREAVTSSLKRKLASDATRTSADANPASTYAPGAGEE